MYKLNVLVSVLCLLFVNVSKSQYIEQQKISSNNLAVPFILLSSDAISSGMGESGSALFTNGQNYETSIANIALSNQQGGIILTYTPWLRNLVKDRKLAYAGGFYKISENLSISAAVNYLSYGQLNLVDDENLDLGSVTPSELVVSFGAARLFGSNFALGMKAKLISSKMYNGSNQNLMTQSGTGFCADISAVHLFPLNGQYVSSFSIAINVLNIGPKLSYFEQTEEKFYLPTSLKIGAALKVDDGSENTIGVAVDISKLLVADTEITTDRSVMQGIISSFDSYMLFQDIGYSIGAEYTFKKKVSFRLGYNLQNSERLMGSFFSVGTGFTHKDTSLNVSYILGDQQKTFLSNTMRISLALGVF